MNSPDFKETGRLIRMAEDLDSSFGEMFEERPLMEKAIAENCALCRVDAARSFLADIPVEELKGDGVRIKALQEAGYHTFSDLDISSDSELMSVQGIGEKQVSSIRNRTDSFLHTLAQSSSVTFSADEKDKRKLALLTLLARYRQVTPVITDALPLRDELHSKIADITSSIRIRSSIRWFFSRRKSKEETIRQVGRLVSFCGDPRFTRALHLVSSYREALALDEKSALADFGKNSAAYYALIEKLTGSGLPSELVYSSVPAQLASKINEQELDLQCFRGDLRSYQTFGARYILHQKRVLLGDEMGLGKTVQAIAAMCHLHAADPAGLFLIVCPASVMINWCREIRKFSSMDACLLHGKNIEEMFDRWSKEGCAAVTNYESMGKIAGRIDNKLRLSMMVIDEAHYIKNPKAWRTKYVRSLENESDHILLMTGTPLENRVDEMCELIGFLRPDMETEIREQAQLRHTSAFREKLAPVYLRRKRSQVLTELPPAIEQKEWCVMTPQDLAAYSGAIEENNFMAMRRVSFLQEDMQTSSKALRLKELCDEICEEGRKAVIFSYFRETIRKVEDVLQEACTGVITGSIPALERQKIIDRFSDADGGSVLICQIQAGGTGLNLQSASVVIFCEPQIKPSLANQAFSRVYRMGQVQSVLVCHLLCEDTVDETVMEILEEKQILFSRFADESAIADASEDLADPEWIREVIGQQRSRYLPAVIT